MVIIILIKDARVENQENPRVQTVRDHMLLYIKGVQNIQKAGIQTTYGQPPKVVRLSSNHTSQQ